MRNQINYNDTYGYGNLPSDSNQNFIGAAIGGVASIATGIIANKGNKTTAEANKAVAAEATKQANIAAQIEREKLELENRKFLAEQRALNPTAKSDKMRTGATSGTGASSAKRLITDENKKYWIWGGVGAGVLLLGIGLYFALRK